jgi:hypothetical protein
MGDRWPTVPAILTSGYKLDSPLLPNVVYLQKPLSFDRLVDTVSMILKPDRSVEMQQQIVSVVDMTPCSI